MLARAVLALAAASVPLAAAQTITVVSKCSFPMYLWDVVNSYGDGPPTTTLQPGTTTWSSNYQSKSSGGGASVKVKPNNNIFDGGPLVQIEYKQVMSPLQVFYDYSLINGPQLQSWPMAMTTSDSSCPSLTCTGDGNCPGAYYNPDDTATMGCNGSPDLTITFCYDGTESSSSSSSSSGSSSPAESSSSQAAAAPAPSPTTTPAAANGGDFLENQGSIPVETVFATTVVGVTITKHVPAATPDVNSDGSISENKREAHLHEHAHRDGVRGRHYHA